MKRNILIIIMLLVVLSLAGCTPNDGTYTLASPAGFWWGLWHGMISVITFIWSLFDPNVGIYESINSGAWYNFGFMIGIGGFSAGASSSSKSKRR